MAYLHEPEKKNPSWLAHIINFNLVPNSLFINNPAFFFILPGHVHIIFTFDIRYFIFPLGNLPIEIIFHMRFKKVGKFTYWLDLLSIQFSSIHQDSMDGIASSSCLQSSWSKIQKILKDEKRQEQVLKCYVREDLFRYPEAIILLQ